MHRLEHLRSFEQLRSKKLCSNASLRHTNCGQPGMRRLLMLGAAGAAMTTITLAAANGPIRCGIEMRHVALRAADGVVLNIGALDGEFVARAPGEPPVFDDPSSYVVRLRSADI